MEFMATFEPKISRIESATSVQSKIKAARELARDGRPEEAEAELDAALLLDPNSKPAHLMAGTIKARLRKGDDAIREFKEVLRIDPLNVQAHLRLARVHIARKEIDKAQEYVESALRIDSQSPIIHLFLGFIFTQRKSLEQAKDHLGKALRFNPRLVRARTQLAVVHRMEGNRKEALAELNAAMRIEPDNAEVYEASGRLHLACKDYGEAREAFERACSLKPESTSAKLGLIEALVVESQIDRAEEILRGLSSRMEGKANIHKLWGDVYFARGLYREATEEFGAAQVLTLGEEEATSFSPTPESLPADDDLDGWRRQALALKEATDEFRDQQRENVAIGMADEAD